MYIGKKINLVKRCWFGKFCRTAFKSTRFLLFFVCCICSASFSFANSDEQSKVETAFIYQFTNYITWPADSTRNSFVISVAGSSPITGELEDLAKTKSIKGQKLEIHQITESSQLKKSDIIVLASSNEKILEEIVKKTRGTNTLIISFSSGFASKGAMINFYIEEGRLRFEINRSSLEKEELHASSQLLKLAKMIE